MQIRILYILLNLLNNMFCFVFFYVFNNQIFVLMYVFCGDFGIVFGYCSFDIWDLENFYIIIREIKFY